MYGQKITSRKTKRIPIFFPSSSLWGFTISRVMMARKDSVCEDPFNGGSSIVSLRSTSAMPDALRLPATEGTTTLPAGGCGGTAVQYTIAKMGKVERSSTALAPA